MIVIISPEAEADLERIGNAIAEHNLVRAVTFVRELRRKCARRLPTPRRDMPWSVAKSTTESAAWFAATI
jgi:plasmid stabilization system protein ParE